MISKEKFQITDQGISARDKIMIGFPPVADILYWDGHHRITKITNCDWAVENKDFCIKLAAKWYNQNKRQKGYYLCNHLNKRSVCLVECSFTDTSKWNEMAKNLIGKYISIDPFYALADDLPDVITEDDYLELILHDRDKVWGKDGFTVSHIDEEDGTVMLKSIQLTKLNPERRSLLTGADVWVKLINTKMCVELGDSIWGEFSHHPHEALTKGIPTFSVTKHLRDII